MESAEWRVKILLTSPECISFSLHLERKLCVKILLYFPEGVISTLNSPLFTLSSVFHANSIRHPPQVSPPPKPTSSTRLPGPTFPCSRSSLRTRGMLAAEVLPYS